MTAAELLTRPLKIARREIEQLHTSIRNTKLTANMTWDTRAYSPESTSTLAQEMESFRLTLASQEPSASLIALIRRHTELPVGEIRWNLIHQRPIIEEQPHHNSYEDFISRTDALVADLEAANELFVIEVDGEVETTEYMRNIFQRWFDIGDQLADYDDRVAKAHEQNGG